MPINMTFTGTQGGAEGLGDAYTRMIGRLNALAQEPYRPYGRTVPVPNAPEGSPKTRFEPFPRLAPISSDTARAHTLGRQENTMAPYMAQSQAYTQRGTQTFPENFSSYMNPYQDRVVNAISELGNRNFRENVLPALESQFVGAGAYGGGRHRDLAQRAARDLNESIAREQGRALAAGYSQAGTLFGQDRARQMEAAGQTNDLGRMGLAQRLADIEALGSQGRFQQEQAQNDLNMQYDAFQREHQHPWDIESRMSNIMQGIPMQTNQTTYTQNPAPPQMSAAGNIGSMAAQLLGASMMGGGQRFRRGGGVKISNRLLRQMGI